MKALGVAALVALGFVGFAHAADVALPTTKPAGRPQQNCFANVWAYLNSTAADCPLSYAGLHPLCDARRGSHVQYEWRGLEPGVRQRHARVSSASRAMARSGFWSPNNINQSVIGIKMSEPIGYGWSVVGTLEAGFDPISGWARQFAALASP